MKKIQTFLWRRMKFLIFTKKLNNYQSWVFTKRAEFVNLSQN